MYSMQPMHVTAVAAAIAGLVVTVSSDGWPCCPFFSARRANFDVTIRKCTAQRRLLPAYANVGVSNYSIDSVDGTVVAQIAAAGSEDCSRVFRAMCGEN